LIVADVAVSSEGRLDLLVDSTPVATLQNAELKEAKGLVYLQEKGYFLFSNVDAIFQLKIDADNVSASQITTIVKPGSTKYKISMALETGT